MYGNKTVYRIEFDIDKEYELMYNIPRRNKQMKVLNLLPVQFNIATKLQGEFTRLDVVGDHFVIYGTPSNTESLLWLAGTGVRLPDNIGEHFQTYRWRSTGQNLVVHVFELFVKPVFSANNAPLYVFRENVQQDFSLDFAGDIIALEQNTPNNFDVWYITDAETEDKQEVSYEIYLKNDSYLASEAGIYRSTILTGEELKVVRVWNEFAKKSAPSQSSGNFSVSFSKPVERVDNGMVFMYTKQDGTERLVRCKHIEFGVNASTNEQFIKAWDLDRKDWRQFYLSSIKNFPTVV